MSNNSSVPSLILDNSNKVVAAQFVCELMPLICPGARTEFYKCRGLVQNSFMDVGSIYDVSIFL